MNTCIVHNSFLSKYYFIKTGCFNLNVNIDSIWFCVYNKDNKTTNFIENSFKNSNGGAGTMTSEMAAELGASKVISGHFGPKAKDLLEKLQIQMVEIHEEKLQIEDIINKL